MEYVNIFQGDFIMGFGSLFNLATKFLGNTGASQQPAAIQREPQKQQPPTTALEQVNAAVRETNPQELNQLHAAPAETTAPSTAAITPEIIPNQTTPLAATNQQEIIKPSAIKLEISQEAVETLKPILSKAVKTLMEIIPFIAAEIKTILPKSEVGEILSNITKNNGGPEAAQQWLDNHVTNNPILARANTPNPTANPA